MPVYFCFQLRQNVMELLIVKQLHLVCQFFSYATGGVPSYVKSECNGYALPLSSTGYDFAE